MATATHNLESETGVRHAGVGVRILANLLDIVILGLPVGLAVALALNVMFSGEDATAETGLFTFWTSIDTWANFVLLGAITILLWVNWDGRTPGKKLMNIRVVSYPAYGKVGYASAMVRMLVGIGCALMLFVPYIASVLMIAIREDRRGFHDIVAGTAVVHEKREG